MVEQMVRWSGQWSRWQSRLQYQASRHRPHLSNLDCVSLSSMPQYEQEFEMIVVTDELVFP